MYRYSRLRFAMVLTDDGTGKQFSTEYAPYVFIDLPDNIEHITSAGDTWWSLAATYYAAFTNPSLLYWVICDFQPGGIVIDPTIDIAPGTVVYIPSPLTVDQAIFNSVRRPDLGL